ncbi:MAG: insulinase family protein, partial [Gemmataceae bacterium]|nr:insulinase family protein [Gemmataceae bacterium]
MKRLMSSVMASLLLLTWLANLAPLAAQEAKATQEAKAKKIITIEGITEHQLPNGAKFLLFPDPSASTVTINMTVLVGSRHEGYGETGMAHLLEHMLFKGSKNYPAADKALIDHGAGRSANGTTWVDRTNYYETMPATDENLEFGIKFEADRLLNCFIKREDLAKEMTVVRNEFEMGENSPDNVLNQRMMAVAFEWHNYGKSTIGNRSDIERVPIENLQAFYRKYYQPDNIVLIVTGKFNQEKAIRLIEEHFGSMKRPERVLSNTYTEEPAQDGERTVILRRVGKVAVVGVMYHIPAATHYDNAVCDVLNLVLGDQPAGRLYKALVETKKATQVGVGTSNWHDPGVLEVYAHVADKVRPEEVRDIIIRELEDMKPITKEEVDRAIKKYLSFREQSLANSKRIGLELSEWIGAGDWRMLFIHRDRVARTTAEECNAVVAKYLKQSNRTVGLFFPSQQVARTPIPERPSVAELVKDYKGGKAIAAGEAFDPTPANIEARVRRITLPSGVKVALLPKKTRGETVVGQIAMHFGNEKSLNGFQVACELLGPLMKRGTEKYTRQQIDDLLAKLSSSLAVGSDTGELTASWQSKRANLPALLEIVDEVLRRPIFPENEFDEIRRQNAQQIAKSMTDPQPLAANAFRRKLNPYPKTDIRYQPTLQESLERWHKVTRDDVVRVYREQVGATGEVVIVGDFDVEATVKQLEKIFGSWKARTPFEKIRMAANTKVAGSQEDINTPDKENAVYLAGQTFPLKKGDPDYAALLIGNHLLGGNFASRLVDRLRQKEGLCYGVGSRVRSDAEDPYSMFMIFAIANPQNIGKVDAGALQEVNKIIKDGVSADELDAGKKAYLQDLAVERGK